MARRRTLGDRERRLRVLKSRSPGSGRSSFAEEWHRQHVGWTKDDYDLGQARREDEEESGSRSYPKDPFEVVGNNNPAPSAHKHVAAALLVAAPLALAPIINKPIQMHITEFENTTTTTVTGATTTPDEDLVRMWMTHQAIKSFLFLLSISGGDHIVGNSGFLQNRVVEAESKLTMQQA